MCEYHCLYCSYLQSGKCTLTVKQQIRKTSLKRQGASYAADLECSNLTPCTPPPHADRIEAFKSKVNILYMQSKLSADFGVSNFGESSPICQNFLPPKLPAIRYMLVCANCTTAVRDAGIMLLLCYSAMLKFLTYYALNYAANSQLITSSTVVSIASQGYIITNITCIIHCTCIPRQPASLLQ